MSLFLLIYAVVAQPSEQSASAVSSGGGSAADGGFQISATIGQTALMSGASSSEGMLPGFWPVVNTNLSPVVLFNSFSFGVVTVLGEEVPFHLIISNDGTYPLVYEIATEATWESYDWLRVSKGSGQLASGRRDTIDVSVVETWNLQVGLYKGRLLITTNTGPGLSLMTDTARVSLTLLPEMDGFAGGDTIIPAGDSPPVEITGEDGNSSGVTFDFSESEGGSVSATFIPSPPAWDSTTVFDDPDQLVTDPVYGDSYWEISTAVPEGFTVDITFDYAGQEGVSNPRQLRLARRMNYAGPTVAWEFLDTSSVAVDEVNSTITALSQSGFSQWTVASERAHNAFEDTRAPVISDLTVFPSAPQVLDSITVYAMVADESSLGSVVLHYVKGGESIFTEVAMTSDEPGVYHGVIPAEDVKLTGIACVVRATDMPGHITESDTLPVEVSFSAGDLSSAMDGSAFPGGIPRDRWSLISVPADLDDPGVGSLFQDELKGKPSKTTWRMFEWTGSKWVAASDVSPGEGYWLYQMVREDVVVAAGPGHSLSLTGAELSLEPGWNVIGSPYSFVVDLDLDQAQFYGPLTYGLDFVGGEGWSDVVTRLLPWGGYIVYNRGSSAETIRIDPLKGIDGPARLSQASGGGQASDLKEDRDGWILRLMAKGNRYSDLSNSIGRVAGAHEQLDHFDNPEPPYLDGYVSLAMDRPEWGPNGPKFTSDIRSMEETNGTWDISLYVRGETGAIQLTDEIVGDVPPHMDAVLLDLVTRKTYDLIRGHDEILITAYIPAGRSGGVALPYPFKVITGLSGYVKATVSEVLAMLPDKIVLSQNFPNPFNPLTRIHYALPAPQQVKLKIYNILGQEVVTLVDGWKAGGYHEVIWAGRDRFDRDVASGIYFSRLSTGSRVLIRKMTVIR
ncbi:MAG: T9SS type A sorting domain-containing protein [Candidatus Neomarinimicrobiota bacterium]